MEDCVVTELTDIINELRAIELRIHSIINSVEEILSPNNKKMQKYDPDAYLESEVLRCD